MNNTDAPLIYKLAANDASVIYVATRLFDIEEKIKAQLLETAVLRGVASCMQQHGLSELCGNATFVPFRDASQEDIQGPNKTELLYQKDMERLERTILVIAYVDGLSKDEGVCFELGFATAKNKPIIIISTDFFSHQLPNGETVPFDPVLLACATKVIRMPQLAKIHDDFGKNLVASRELVLSEVSQTIENVLSLPVGQPPARVSPVRDAPHQIFIEFGGEVFEWQSIMASQLAHHLSKKVNVVRPMRYRCKWESPHDAPKEAWQDLLAIHSSELVITCSDADECSAGTAFIQGYARGLKKEVWLYNSKITKIVADVGYTSSRNLMLDYSADRTFNNFNHLLEALAHKYQLRYDIC